MKRKTKKAKIINISGKNLPKKSKNEKEISPLDDELKNLVIILNPSNTSKIYEKFE